ncbi:MAG: Tol-Pal system beta propeller repeat protein TolB [Gammaproteobacteria bacterium]|nr:Tol-Pal system beta propeller repeat protein TolB [Gammaproteobacteria bacterium]NIM72198.1 Tol-Pal system beta propeller repeat protein TolB [Gammaproteobacteria bacterium]NIN39113.1 Tol-Pal system beta propeller repeat protein TolB [Gammaproteobacteria bacterium]NIO23946.1 Tol-Pal system beta propeller repeat protein TolB [Gammaproteobacteria bacterium]NIO64598.1 Tol-Pal system beta propeller repeat protein TolB [Gammaproteobacteria bacterium]
MLMASLPRTGHAVLTIRITQGIEGALPIAIVPFGLQAGAQPPPVDVAQIVANDLTRSGRFSPLPFGDLPSRPSEASAVNFADFRLLGMNNLVIGKVRALANGRYSLEFRLFDVFRGAQVKGYEFEAAPDELRRKAHQISDIVYEALTGERGAFDTRIAYVTEKKSAAGSRYALNVADSDGFNPQVVLDSKSPIVSPSWSPDGSQLAYVSFEGNRPRIFAQNLSVGTRQVIAAFPGLNGAPAWSPDGKSMAMTLSKDGNPEVYVMDIATRLLKRLTVSAAIDTEPAWSPDGKSLVFTSDRGGTPQIYRIPASGGQATRLTFEGKYNSRATFAPDGKSLSLVHGDKGTFRIAVLDLENNALRVLTKTTLDESPSFAPNGSMLLYATTDAGGGALAGVSTDGRVRQELAAQQGDVREPAWSPFRQP